MSLPLDALLFAVLMSRRSHRTAANMEITVNSLGLCSIRNLPWRRAPKTAQPSPAQLIQTCPCSTRDLLTLLPSLQRYTGALFVNAPLVSGVAWPRRPVLRLLGLKDCAAPVMFTWHLSLFLGTPITHAGYIYAFLVRKYGPCNQEEDCEALNETMETHQEA
ncbi:hypothetical protein BD289DRAFT_57388 [Coniella lustricola]|uniref:Uncharacterized protein n=1 Tax=Coniella lustricola TaxID=2025994 RepID=A0A2T3AIB1_9PEZI|nr:hypothetical protein BD289DRAFT_57388 [Coniella lustricola]